MADQLAPSPNEEAIRAWDTVLYERFKQYRHIFVAGLGAHGEDALRTDAPGTGARCLDIGCGFGDTTQRLAGIAGEGGSALGVDSGANFIADATREAKEAGVQNVEFEVADVQAAHWEPQFDYAFSRMGTMFFANPVQAMRGVREALVPDGKLCMVVWRSKAENPWMIEAERVVERFLTHPDETDADTCGPGPFSMANADTTSGVLKSAGYTDITLRRCDLPYLCGKDVEEAVEVGMALGPAAELIRVTGEEGEARKPEIASALREAMAPWASDEGVIAPASTWIVTARNPG
ncbi:MAG: class I SAM-dependent methyltransferase [Thermoleophilaceae bacterium]|nr:class I SAM-dependent methyltransferase [Thermoleophilaceae bacterium]